MSYFHTPSSPLAVAIRTICGVDPALPVEDIEATTGSSYYGQAIPMDGIWHSREMSEEHSDMLSDFCAYHAPEFFTGDSVLEMAELGVERAVENDNIDASPHVTAKVVYD
jgi:hypothetical protein